MGNKQKNHSLPGESVAKAAFGVYDILWRLAIPGLKRNKRLATGFQERIFRRQLMGNADIWIQAASVGEAYLAWELLKIWPRHQFSRILLTTNTLQGKEILDRAVADIGSRSKPFNPQVAYFPFDRPAIMRRVVSRVRPRVMVLLETEIWPGLLMALKSHGCPAIIINGRLTLRSLSRYMIWPSLWHTIRPQAVLAISKEDADRFSTLFGKSGVGTMHNIKFDRIEDTGSQLDQNHTIDTIVQPGTSFVVIGSVRQGEEADVALLIKDFKKRRPDAVIGLFPRHLHRVASWQNRLTEIGVPWVLRSSITKPATKGRVVLWDRFGELNPAYRRASAAFVGGSLAPLGGQNFLEPLITGLTPAIGPHWENFTWVGPEIKELKLVHQAESWQDVSRYLADCIVGPADRSEVKNRAGAYIQQRQGGTRKALELILRYL